MLLQEETEEKTKDATDGSDNAKKRGDDMNEDIAAEVLDDEVQVSMPMPCF